LEKFENVHISVEPNALRKIKKSAQDQNMTFSRFVTNSALNASEGKPLTKAQTEELQREIRPLVLKALEEELSKKITGCHSAEDFRKFLEVKKRSEGEEISRALGFDEPAQVPDPYDIATGKVSIQKANLEIAKDESQKMKKFLEEVD
jgi:hypothetical protein